MTLKCVCKDDAGGVHLIVREFDSAETAYAELELEGYRVYSVSLSDGSEFRIVN